MFLKRPFFLLSPLLLASCIGVGDSIVYLKGYINNTQNTPLSGVMVSYNGVIELTDRNGCFYFGGAYPSQDIEILILPEVGQPLSFQHESGLYQLYIVAPSKELLSDSEVQWDPVSNEKSWEAMRCSDT